MSVTKDEMKKFLSRRKISVNAFIVPQDVTFVSTANVANVEIFGFISSVILLIAGVFLGVILTPDHAFFNHFIVCGIVTFICGIIVFFSGVHREISEWKKKRIPLE